MGFKDKVLGKIATKFGKIVDGQYKGMEVGLGSDDGKIISAAPPNQVILFDGDTQVSRLKIGRAYDIKECLTDGKTFTLIYADNSTSVVVPHKPSFAQKHLAKGNADEIDPDHNYKMLEKAFKYIIRD